MTPAEKAKSLIVQYKNILPRMDYSLLDKTAKQCVLIALAEILNLQTVWYAQNIADEPEQTTEFWEQVKEEINKTP